MLRKIRSWIFMKKLTNFKIKTFVSYEEVSAPRGAIISANFISGVEEIEIHVLSDILEEPAEKTRRAFKAYVDGEMVDHRDQYVLSLHRDEQPKDMQVGILRISPPITLHLFERVYS